MAAETHIKIVLADESLRPWAEKLARGEADAGEEIYRARNRVTRCKVHGKDLCIKCFKMPGAINSLVYTHLRESKARRSYENALALQRLGFDTPAPIGYIEVKQGCRLRESYYICQYEEAQTVRDWELKPDCEPLLHSLAAELLKLHRAHVFVKDYSPGNILYQKRDDGTYRFMYVDLNRMKFSVSSEKTLMRNFRAIHLDAAQTRRFARHYALAAGRDPEAMEDLAETQLNCYLKEKQRLKSLKKLFKHKR